MPPRQGRYVTNKKIDMKSLKRLLQYVFKRYSFRLLIVLVCISVFPGLTTALPIAMGYTP